MYIFVVLAEYMTMARVGRAAGLCEREWLLLAMLVVVPVAQVPTFTEASFLALAFFVAMLFTAAALLYEAAAHPYACPEYDEYDAASALDGFSQIAFAYSGLAIFPEMIAEMRAPREFCGATGSLAIAYYAIAPLYALSGVVPFWAWGTETQPNVLYNFARGRLADVVLGAQVAMALMGQLQNHLLFAGSRARAGRRAGPSERRRRRAPGRPCTPARSCAAASSRSSSSSPRCCCSAAWATSRRSPARSR